jgi:periodic tryptophan protein 1
MKNSHTDAVLSINMHPNRNNLLASGSADCNVKIWDLFESECKMTISIFTEKVQTVHWSPLQEKLLAVGGFDNCVSIVNMDSSTDKISHNLGATIEKIEWSPTDPNGLAASTETGLLAFYDIRNMSTPLFKTQAHESQTVIGYSTVSGLFATASLDKTVKLWNLMDYSVIIEKDMGVEKLFALEFSKDTPFILTTGGSDGRLAIWDTQENAQINAIFS